MNRVCKHCGKPIVPIFADDWIHPDPTWHDPTNGYYGCDPSKAGDPNMTTYVVAEPA